MPTRKGRGRGRDGANEERRVSGEDFVSIRKERQDGGRGCTQGGLEVDRRLHRSPSLIHLGAKRPRLLTPTLPCAGVDRSVGTLRRFQAMPVPLQQDPWHCLRIMHHPSNKQVHIVQRQRSIDQACCGQAFGGFKLRCLEGSLAQPHPNVAWNGAPVVLQLHQRGAFAIKVGSSGLLEGSEGTLVFVRRFAYALVLLVSPLSYRFRRHPTRRRRPSSLRPRRP